MNKGPKKRVAVVGAGTSGLMAIKSLKEDNFEPICFEKTSYFGGLWHYHDEDVDGVPSLMWSTSLNNSKEVGAISDFPPRPEFPNYMRHFQVLEMFAEYGERFDLFKHIRYNKEVIKVLKDQSYQRTGRWRVVVKDILTDEIEEEVYDAVLICTGHLSIPNIANFPQMKSYKGEIIHTHSVKKFQNFNNKTVCVVGTGSSALDAAVEISHTANQVYLSIRHPCWIYGRQGPYGYPLDWTLFTWDHTALQQYVPINWTNKVLKEIFINPRFSHSLYNINPTGGPANRDPAVNDTIASRMMNGSIILKKNINYFTENGVVFVEEGAKETKVDAVVLGTGYNWDFPFLDDKDLVVNGQKIHLYKCIYPPHLTHPTLGIVGFIVPMGPGFPCVEMQCRYFSYLLSGKGKLPSKQLMEQDIEKQYRENVKRYGEGSRVSVHVDFAPYLEDLSTKIGANPSMLKLLFTDFQLFVACAIGPYLPYRFRLTGPHRWEGARQAILTAGERMRAPLQGEKAFQKDNAQRSYKAYILFCLAVIAWYIRKKDFVNYETITKLYQHCLMLRSLAVNVLENSKLCK
ncbi:flavin-containing monooxygenase 5-like [Uloborus diversus]|uniref:flavin-containing monooxygenase 5-like n=1 Tax=Uloborus diversus TaxID=327109 RepID=UPI0024092C66|nr:flavin-containing monooxygenase 5-like [Uloborus diversus]